MRTFRAVTAFLSTLPARGATTAILAVCRLPQFLSTLPARGATERLCDVLRRLFHFYPRSPRGERQVAIPPCRASTAFLSTLPARGATRRRRNAGLFCRFLSTLPARGATKERNRQHGGIKFLSTLPARGATKIRWMARGQYNISIHAPREGSDRHFMVCDSNLRHFYPRSPRGERRLTWHPAFHGGKFLSTLPARGATWRGCPGIRTGIYFYPRSPRGERPACLLLRSRAEIFLSTLPARGATAGRSTGIHDAFISIHAPREGSDASTWPRKEDDPYFYPRSPRGERPDNAYKTAGMSAFLSTLPARGATSSAHGCRPAMTFLSTLPARGATRPLTPITSRYAFLSTLPARGATDLR